MSRIGFEIPGDRQRDAAIFGYGLAAGLALGAVLMALWLSVPQWVGHNGRAYKVIDLGCVSPRGCW